jgi:hypothetical protein
MADRAALRLGVDLAFAAAAVACGVAAYALSGPPAVPRGVCSSDAGAPRYDELYADGRLSIGIVIGELAGGPADHNAWSAHVLQDELRARGIPFDLELVRDRPAAIGAALDRALATHEIVYYNGHSYRGKLKLRAPDDYRLVFLDTCWSTQLYSPRLVGPAHDVIANADRSITGSVESFLVLLDGLRARADWREMLERMNRRAAERAHHRSSVSRFKHPERYRRDVRCM